MSYDDESKPSLFVVPGPNSVNEKPNGLKELDKSEEKHNQNFWPKFEIFTFKETIQIRSILKDGEPWFIAGDICRALEIVNISGTCNLLDDDEKADIRLTDVSGKLNKTLIVNESGLYSLIINSRKREAKIFRKWITSEVLPSIRKTGSYSLSSTDSILNKFIEIQEVNNKKFFAVQETMQLGLNNLISRMDILERTVNNQFQHQNNTQAITTYQSQTATTAMLISKNITHATVSQFLKNSNKKLNYVRYSILGVSNALSKALYQYPNCCDGKNVRYFGSVKAFPVELLTMYFTANQNAAIAIV